MTDRPLIKMMVVILLLLAGCAPATPTARIATVPPGSETPVPSPAPTEPTATAVSPPTTSSNPFDLIAQEHLFDTLEDLTAIQPYSGWRNSASEGEAEALDYVEQRLHEMTYLGDLGIELERQTFSVFLGTELWETRVDLTIDGQTVEVPADGMRGDRDVIARAIRFDSDGALNDERRDPVMVEGPVVVVETADELAAIRRDDVTGKVVLVHYQAVDRITRGHRPAVQTAADLLAREPAGVVLVTWFSNAPRESHGAFVGDLSAFTYLEEGPSPPILYVRMEDLAPAGIVRWADLERVEAVQMTWDADVRSPAPSGNLVTTIPGADRSQAVILGAHIDSPNGPGAMDDGSGSAVLLEVARVLDLARAQPPVDLVLVWFGSEELGLYGSYHFASTHQELLDRSLAMLQIDCLTRPLDGIEGYLNLVTWSYGRLGDDQLTWPNFLVEAAEPHGVWAYAANYYGIESDNTALTGFDVPNANLIYMNHPEMEALGSLHYAGHIHDPYDTVELARDVAGPLEEMARLALLAALETDSAEDLRVARDPDRRAVFVGSHTEAIHMSPTTFTDLGMALAWEGFDVDLIPYGQPVTAEDLTDADLVVALPVIDYPSPEGDPLLYDTAWDGAEVTALAAYVDAGGLLVLTNSAHRLKYTNWVQDPNEDWADVNALASRFGVIYRADELPRSLALSSVDHPLVDDVDGLELIEQNSVSFQMEEGEVLAHANGIPALALVEHGEGQVVVLAEVGMLNSGGGEPANLPFWLNLARYARSRR